MKRLVLAVLVIAVVGRITRRIAQRKFPELMEHMMEDVMPDMMDACFAHMGPQRRRFMIAHCRGMLDRMEAKDVGTQPRSEPQPLETATVN